MINKTIPEQAPKVQATIDGRIMYSDYRAEAILLTLKPSEGIPLHKNPFDVLFAGIEGDATLVTPDTEMTIKPGETIFVTSDEERAWKNNGNTIARILVVKLLQTP